MSTRAIKFLNSKGIAFKPLTYEHKKKGAEFAANALGFALNKTIKTLVVEVGSKGFYFVLMPGDAQLDLKKLAKAMAEKRAQMAEPRIAEKLTGYLTGGISPFGAQKSLPVIMQADLLEHEEVLINGGRRGLLLLMSPEDIRRVTGAVVLDIAKKLEHKGRK